MLAPVRCDAQWWRSAPVDFESCADVAERAKTKEEKTAKLAECNAKYAGRRKPGGGYTYYDFMQDRTFDIAGPNPTPEEQKRSTSNILPTSSASGAATSPRRWRPSSNSRSRRRRWDGSRSRCAPNRSLLHRLKPKKCRCRWQVRSSRRRASRRCNAPRTNSRVNGRGFQRKSTSLKGCSTHSSNSSSWPSKRRARYFCRLCLVRNCPTHVATSPQCVRGFLTRRGLTTGAATARWAARCSCSRAS